MVGPKGSSIAADGRSPPQELEKAAIFLVYNKGKTRITRWCLPASIVGCTLHNGQPGFRCTISVISSQAFHLTLGGCCTVSCLQSHYVQ